MAFEASCRILSGIGGGKGPKVLVCCYVWVARGAQARILLCVVPVAAEVQGL